MLVFIILIGIVSAAQLILQRKSQSVYDVQAGGSSGDVEKGSKEAENKAFERVEKKEEKTEEKWVKNYVPYGDYPNGNEAVKQVLSEAHTHQVGTFARLNLWI